MTFEELRSHDPADMYTAIREVPRHLREGVELGRGGPKVARAKARRIVVLGMGGSAIGGDLLRSYVRSFASNDVSLEIVRGYEPPHVDNRTLVIASSYSGNTEETLTAFEGVRGKAGEILVATTGGRLLELAEKEGYRKIVLPGGLQPRAALAYSFFPLLFNLAVKNELFGEEVARVTEQGIEETATMLDGLSKKYGAGEKKGNAAWSLAERINGRVPVIYSSSDRLDTVNLRWRGQIQENAKYLAFGNLLPEMNHNEINGWSHPEDLVGKFIAIFLRDGGDHPRVSARMEITRRTIGRTAGDTLDVKSTGDSLLARMFSLIHLGDWVSYYLALMNGVDPSPVPVIENLKKQLAKRG